MSANHRDVINAVISVLQGLDLRSFGVVDVVERDYPFDAKAPPCPAIVVSMLTEGEHLGLNNISDIVYPVQILRTGHSLNNKGGAPRASWRGAVRDVFDYKRLGLECELYTKSRFVEMEYDAAWKSYNLDTSGMVVSTIVRKVL